MKQVDILIIGSGPAGLSAAIYGIRGNATVLVAEKEYLGTGQIAESGQVDNYLGMVGTSGYDMGERFRADAEKLGTEFYEGEALVIEKKDEQFIVTFENGEEIKAKSVIYAAGAVHRHLGLKEEKQWEGKGISYCAICDGAFYKDKAVVVVGGGDTALDDATYLSDLCEKVYLVHRREAFRGSQKTLAQLREKDNVDVITNAQITNIEGEKKVSKVILDSGRTLEVSGVFVAIGMIPQTKVVENLVELENGYIKADETGKTSISGFFVAGDVRTKALRQVVTAVADGANAAISALSFLENL